MLRETREEAKRSGSKRYFDGKPCLHGHIAEHYTSNGSCIVCVRERGAKRHHKVPPPFQKGTYRLVVSPKLTATSPSLSAISDLLAQLANLNYTLVSLERAPE
jgi:hypothetical protein